MTNKEKLIAIIGEENFRRFEANLALKGKDPAFFVHNYGINVLISSFFWGETTEGHEFWSNLHQKVISNWNTVNCQRLISPEEHDLIFKMFCMEWMGYPQRESADYYDYVLSDGLGLKIYEALRSE